MMDINTEQCSRNVGDGNMRIAYSKDVSAAKITWGGQWATIEANRLSRRLNHPNALTPFDGKSDSRLDSGYDNIRVPAADCCSFTQDTLAQWLADANLRVGGRPHRRRIIHSERL
jgi:hypothetical protein